MTPPYTVAILPFGPEAHPRPVKLYPTGQHGGLLAPEEIALWDYVRHLEAEVGRLSRADPEAPPVPPVSPELKAAADKLAAELKLRTRPEK